MFRFAHYTYLYLLLLIPVFTAIYVFIQIRMKKQLRKFGDPELLAHLMPDVSHARRHTKFALMMLALAMSACGKDNKKEVNTQPSAVEVSVAEETPVSVTEISVEEVDPGLEIVEEFVILGEGQKNFNFDVTFADGNIKHYVINTDKETVGDAYPVQCIRS